MIKEITKTKAFTLVEVLLYMIIVSVILLVIISFSVEIMGINRKTVDMQEIVTNIDYISNKLSASVYTATGIEGSSVFNNDIGKLSLNMPVEGDSPTKIYLNDNSVYLQKGNSAAVKISSDYIKCTQLRFAKVSSAKVPDQVIVDMNCEPVNSNSQDSSAELKIHTTLSLRR